MLNRARAPLWTRWSLAARRDPRQRRALPVWRHPGDQVAQDNDRRRQDDAGCWKEQLRLGEAAALLAIAAQAKVAEGAARTRDALDTAAGGAALAPQKCQGRKDGPKSEGVVAEYLAGIGLADV